MYVCLCNALTDRALLQAASAIGSTRPGQVYAACGCRLQCGQCVRGVAKLLRDHAGEPADYPMAAE
nr:(2Fe-2S)-binding protein [uncultured Rhodopila sp.]